MNDNVTLYNLKRNAASISKALPIRIGWVALVFDEWIGVAVFGVIGYAIGFVAAGGGGWQSFVVAAVLTVIGATVIDYLKKGRPDSWFGDWLDASSASAKHRNGMIGHTPFPRVIDHFPHAGLSTFCTGATKSGDDLSPAHYWAMEMPLLTWRRVIPRRGRQVVAFKPTAAPSDVACSDENFMKLRPEIPMSIQIEDIDLVFLRARGTEAARG